MLIEAQGRLGATATFDGHTLVLRRDGYSRGVTGKGERSIHVSQIAAVEWKPAGKVMDGFIRFVVSGTIARRGRFGTQSNDARFDEWAVPFWRKAQPEFERLRDAVESAIAEVRGGGQPQPASVADELGRLADLRDRGVLTDAEFEAKKQRLLG